MRLLVTGVVSVLIAGLGATVTYPLLAPLSYLGLEAPTMLYWAPFAAGGLFFLVLVWRRKPAPPMPMAPCLGRFCLAGFLGAVLLAAPIVYKNLVSDTAVVRDFAIHNTAKAELERSLGFRLAVIERRPGEQILLYLRRPGRAEEVKKLIADFLSARAQPSTNVYQRDLNSPPSGK